MHRLALNLLPPPTHELLLMLDIFFLCSGLLNYESLLAGRPTDSGCQGFLNVLFTLIGLRDCLLKKNLMNRGRYFSTWIQLPSAMPAAHIGELVPVQAVLLPT